MNIILQSSSSNALTFSLPQLVVDQHSTESVFPLETSQGKSVTANGTGGAHYKPCNADPRSEVTVSLWEHHK